jgi:hypothetical protein
MNAKLGSLQRRIIRVDEDMGITASRQQPKPKDEVDPNTIYLHLAVWPCGE